MNWQQHLFHALNNPFATHSHSGSPRQNSLEKVENKKWELFFPSFPLTSVTTTATTTTSTSLTTTRVPFYSTATTQPTNQRQRFPSKVSGLIATEIISCGLQVQLFHVCSSCNWTWQVLVLILFSSQYFMSSSGSSCGGWRDLGSLRWCTKLGSEQSCGWLCIRLNNQSWAGSHNDSEEASTAVSSFKMMCAFNYDLAKLETESREEKERKRGTFETAS